MPSKGSSRNFANVTDADAQQNALNTLHYAYDSAGNLLSESDNTTSDVYTYDSSNRLTRDSSSSARIFSYCE